VLAKLQMAPLRTFAANDRGSFRRVGRNRDTVAGALGGALIADNRNMPRSASTPQQASMVGVGPNVVVLH